MRLRVLWLDTKIEEVLLEVSDAKKAAKLTERLHATFLEQRRWGVLYIDSQEGAVFERYFDGR